MSVSFYSGSRSLGAFSLFVHATPADVSDAWRAFQGVLTVPRAAERSDRVTAMRVAVGVKVVSSGSFVFDDLIVRRAPSGSLSLRDFGAIRDGAVDDMRAVQAALDFSARQQIAITAPSGRYAVRALVARERCSLTEIGSETLRFPSHKAPRRQRLQLCRRKHCPGSRSDIAAGDRRWWWRHPCQPHD